MLYPQNGSIANGSRRSCPIFPTAAAVCSDAMHAPRKTPCCQDRASVTSGAAAAAEQDRRDRHPGRILPFAGDRGALDGGHGEASVGVGGGLAGLRVPVPPL